MSKGLSRDQLAKFLPNDESIKAFERLFKSTGETPSTIEEAATLAGMAAAVANQALAMLAECSAVLEQLGAAPAPLATADTDDFTPSGTATAGEDDFTPATAVGSMGQQSADAVEIRGGAIDGTPIGATARSTGAFTTLTSLGGTTTTLEVGGMYYSMRSLDPHPSSRSWAIAMNHGFFGNCQLRISDTHDGDPGAFGSIVWEATVDGLAVTAGFGCNGVAPQPPAMVGAAATDLDTSITLVNNIRAALIANGIAN